MAEEQTLQSWHARQELAERMIPLIGTLYRERGVTVRVRTRPLVNSSTIDVLKAHRYVRQFGDGSLDIEKSFPVLEALARLDLRPARVDLAELTFRYAEVGGDLEEFLTGQLGSVIGGPPASGEAQDVVLYGFGRIGRLVARLLIERTGHASRLKLRAIVVRRGQGDDLRKRASLLRRDTVHGPFNGSITIDEANNAIVANGAYIKVIYSDAPDAVDYEAHGIHDAIVIDNTGKWRTPDTLSLHLKSNGVAKVLLTAPGQGDIKNVVYGVNHDIIAPTDELMSAASCTTNAIVPVLKAVNEGYGIVNGHIETVHAYTNEQNLIDNYHKKERRGRSAPLNMVITDTGAATAVAKALPELAGKLTGSAIRVPTPNVSLAIMNLNLARDTDRDDINGFLRSTAIKGDLTEQIDYTTSTEIVSSDLVGSRHAGIIDSQATVAPGGRSCVLYVWYDNEFGYSAQVVRVLAEMADIKIPAVP